MLASIHPLGERARGNRWGVTTTAYVLGSVTAGAFAGGLAGLSGYAMSRLVTPGSAVLALVVAGACLAAAAIDSHALPVGLPTVHRQVNEDWLHRYRGWVYGAGFGAQLGLGMVTVVTTAGVYLTAAMAILAGLQASATSTTGAAGAAGAGAGAVLAGSTVGVAFGLARALPLLLVVGVRSPGQLRRAHRVAGEWDRLARWATVAALTATATAMVTDAAGWRWW